MQLSPRYEGPPVLRIELPIADPAVPVARQRRRLADFLGTLDADQWSAASRCAGWSVKDVIAHLVGTDTFWKMSIAAGLAGAPTRILTSFDPASTPAAMVEQFSMVGPTEVLDQFLSSSNAMLETIAGLDEEKWSLPAEAPPGHVAIRAVALHALWDAWIHERDVMLPLGLEPAVEPDEVTCCLLYASALGPMFLATQGSSRRGTLGVSAPDLKLRFVVDVGSAVVLRPGPEPSGCARLDGSGVDLVEALSCRASPPNLSDQDQWMVEGLRKVFNLVG